MCTIKTEKELLDYIMPKINTILLNKLNADDAYEVATALKDLVSSEYQDLYNYLKNIV